MPVSEDALDTMVAQRLVRYRQASVCSRDRVPAVSGGQAGPLNRMSAFLLRRDVGDGVSTVAFGISLASLSAGLILRLRRSTNPRSKVDRFAHPTFFAAPGKGKSRQLDSIVDALIPSARNDRDRP